MKRNRKFKPYTPLVGCSIDVGGLRYKIKYFKSLIPLDPEDEEYDPHGFTAGWCDLCGREIGIFAYLSKGEHDYTLLHELMHAAMEAVKTAEQFQKEDFIKPLSRILLGAMKQGQMLRNV